MLRSAIVLVLVSLLYSSASAFDQTSLLQVKQEVAAGVARSAAATEESLGKDKTYLKDDSEDEQDEEDTEEDQQTAQQASAAWKSALKAQVMQRLHTQQQPRQQQGKLTYKQAQLQRMAFGQQHAPHGQKLFSQQTVQAAKGKVGHAAGHDFPKVISSDHYASPDISLSLPQQQLISYGMEVQTSVADSAMPMLSAVLGLPDSAFVPPDGSWGPTSGLHQPVLANSEMGKSMGRDLGATIGTMLARQMLGPREADYAPYGYAPSFYSQPAQYYWPHYGYGGAGWVDGVSMPYFPAPLPRVNPYQGQYGYPAYGSMR